ncbi:POK8 protein, partial [Zapornia atra]|nr:POK8 protein [Zapornia atra]
LFEGNKIIDKLVAPTMVVPQVYKQASLSHAFFHQSAKSLAKQFNLSLNQARTIISTCSACSPIPATLELGINSRGLKALELWQTDITFVKAFRNMQYVHVSVDTFSHMIWATAQ